MKNLIYILLFLLPFMSMADTPASATVKAKVYSGDGVTAIGATGDALKVSVSNPTSSTVNQGNAGIQAWLVSVTNASLAVTGPLTDAQLRASPVPFSIASLPLPAGAATSALQTAGNSSLTSIDGKLTTTVNGLKVDGSSVTQPVSVATLPLPSGASTSALQTSGNASLTSIDGKTPALISGRVPVDGSGVTQPVSGSLGRTWNLLFGTDAVDVTGSTVTVGNASLAVTGPLTNTELRATPVPISGSTGRTWALSSGTDSVAVSGTITATNSANGATGSPVPAQATQVGGSDGTNLRAIKVSATGVVSVDGSASTQPISGTVAVSNFPATTAVTQSTSPWIVNGSGFTQPVSGTFFQATQPVSIAGTVAVSGPLTDAQLRATAVPVSLASTIITGTVAATQSGAWTTGRTWTLSNGTDSVAASQSGSWTVTANAGTNLNTSALALDTSVTGLQVSQGSTTSGQKGSLTLGAVTTGSPSYTTAQTSPLSLTTSGALRTDSSAVTQPISAASLPLPTGASTEATLSTLNGKVPSGLTVTSTRLLVDGSGVTQPVSGSLGRTWTLSSGTDSVSAAVSNFPATQAVTQSTSPWVVAGAAASGASKSGNPVQIGGVFNTTQPTVTTGQAVESQSTARGAQIIATGVDALNVTNISGTVSLPTGASTAANQTTGNSSLSSIDGKIPSGLTVTSTRLLTDGSGVIQPISGTVIANIGTIAGIATESTLSTLNGKFGIIGQKNMSGSAPVVIASDQSTINVSATGSVTANAGTNLNTSLLALESGGNLATIKTNTDNLSLAQASSTSGQKGNLVLGAVTTAAPTYTTAQSNPLSLTTGGLLRVDASGAAIATNASQSGSWVVQANAGSNLNTSALATQTTVSSIAGAQTNGTQIAKIGNGTITAEVKAASTAPAAADQALVVSISPNGNNITGNVASAATDSGNPVKVGYVYHTTAPTPTDGQRIDAQANIRGSLLVSPESRVRSYSAASSSVVAATLTTDLCTITGAASTLVKVRKVYVVATTTANGSVTFALLKRSTANSAGTSTTLTNVPHESTDAAASATVRTYTVNPTTGTLVGNVRAARMQSSGAAGTPFQPIEFDFSDANAKPIVLNSASEVLALNFLGVTTAGLTVSCWFEWTEE